MAAKGIVRAVAAAFLFLLLVWGCGKDGGPGGEKGREEAGLPPKGGEVLAQIGNETVTEKELESELAQLPDGKGLQGRSLQELSSYLNSYINRKLILREAANQPPDPKIERQARLFRENLLIQDFLGRTMQDRVATEEKAKEYYESHKKEFISPEQIRVAQMMFKVEPEAKPEERDAARGKAEAALARLEKGEDFAALARQVSEDEYSNTRGGDLGYFTHGRFPPEFEAAAFGLKQDGDLSGIVESRLGLHILKRLGKHAPEALTYDKVREGILSRLGPANRQEAYSQYIKELREANQVKVDTKKLMKMVAGDALRETAEKMGYLPGKEETEALPADYSEGVTD